MKRGSVLLSLSEATSVKMEIGGGELKIWKVFARQQNVLSCEMLWSEVRKSPQWGASWENAFNQLKLAPQTAAGYHPHWWFQDWYGDKMRDKVEGEGNSSPCLMKSVHSVTAKKQIGTCGTDQVEGWSKSVSCAGKPTDFETHYVLTVLWYRCGALFLWPSIAPSGKVVVALIFIFTLVPLE